jgi:glycerol-3-phosphate O-acyltransferase
MNTLASIPLWLLVTLVIFSALGLWLAVIAPLLTRLFYRRRQRSVRRLDQNLEFGLSPYALASRKLWLDRLLTDPEVVRVVASIAEQSGQPLEVVQSRALQDAQEIVPFFNLLLYFRIGYWLGRWVLRTMYWIRTSYDDADALADIDRDSCVVLVSNHRSNLDPFMLIYMASRRSAVSYSAGEWALAWPFRYLLHAIGFYILRREGGGDELHRTLVQRYVFLAASHCMPQGLFLEGGLSRDGLMQPLKLGLLNYLVKARGHGSCRDIVFVPVGLSYDRIPEDRTLLAHQQQGFRDKGRLYASMSFARFAVLMMPRMIGLSKPFGTVVARFGRPISLARWEQETGNDVEQAEPGSRRTMVTSLGNTLRQEIQRLIPILAISLLAEELLLAGQQGVTELQIKHRALFLARRLQAAGEPVILDPLTEDAEFSQALYMILKRGIAELGADGCLRATAAGKSFLEYYRNAIPDTPGSD